MYWAGNRGSCLDPSSATKDIFICLKLASMSFFIADSGNTSLKELSTCWNTSQIYKYIMKVHVTACTTEVHVNAAT